MSYRSWNEATRPRHRGRFVSAKGAATDPYAHTPYIPSGHMDDVDVTDTAGEPPGTRKARRKKRAGGDVQASSRAAAATDDDDGDDGEPTSS